MDIDQARFSPIILIYSSADRICQLHRMVDAGALELAYETSLHEHYTVLEDEKLRRLRVQLILLESRNDDLQTQILEDDDCIRKIQRSSSALEKTLNKAEASLNSAQGEIRIKSREIETLKVGALLGRQHVHH